VDKVAPGQQVPVPEGGSFARVSPTGLQDMMEDKNFVLVNTHVPFEGNLPRTDLSIPYNEIGQSLDRLPRDRSARIVLYCKSGRMSAEAAEELVARGYEDVWDLGGGMDAWRRAGLPLQGV
jgi:rhodanese-related sulfurtransferase